MAVKPTTVMKRRLNIFVSLCIFVLIAWIIINLARVAIIEGSFYQELANSQQLRSTKILANRGSMYDVNGSVLAQSSTVYTIYVDPATMRSHDLDALNKALARNYETAQREGTPFEEGTLDAFTYIVNTLSDILDMDSATIQSYCNKDTSYQEIRKKAEKSVADEVTAFCEKYDLWGISSIPDTKRIYPQNDLGANVIGHIHYDGYGIYGLEAYYDDYLAGIDGRIVTAKDGQGNEMAYRYKQSYDAQDGDSLYLNLDINIQYYVEKALQKAVQTHSAENRGCAIVMECDTGKILAMVTEPDYDPNNPAEIYDADTASLLAGLSGEEYTNQRAEAWKIQWQNKAISELYFPGSVFKVITGSSAVEEKAITLTETFGCGTQITVNSQTFGCWTKAGHGTQTFAEAMINSCNPAFVTIGQRLGIDNFFKYFKAYGLTEKTGIDLPGEAMSSFHTSDTMSLIDLAACSFGQSNKITPIQMITAYAAVVNGGYLVTPYVVDKIEDSNGNVILQNEPIIKRQVISEETSATMREILEGVVNTNNGSNAYIKGYRIGGKSGTSQKLDEDTTGNTYVSSYCAFAPADDPEIIMLVMVDDPRGGQYYGSAVAAPAVSEALSEILPYLGYFPEYTEDEIQQLEVVVPDLEGYSVDKSKSSLENLGLQYEIIGEGETVVKQVPSIGNQIPRNSTIVLYTEENYEEKFVTAPNLEGMTLAEANKAVADAGLNLKPLGGAVYRSGATAGHEQNWKNVLVPRGTIIEAYFYVNDETG